MPAPESPPARRTARRHWSARFLNRLRAHGEIQRAATEAGIHRGKVYRRAQADPKFKRAMDAAREAGNEDYSDRLEAEAYDRAFDRKDKSSHLLLMFLLKARRPHLYRDNAPRAEAEATVAEAWAEARAADAAYRPDEDEAPAADG